MMRFVVNLGILLPVALSAKDELKLFWKDLLRDAQRIPQSEVVAYQNGTNNTAFHGNVCNIKKYPIAGKQPHLFYACLRPTNDEKVWPWREIGTWTKMKCKHGRWFSPEHRLCRSAKSVKRQQQSFCASWPNYCQQPIAPLPIPAPVPAPPVYLPAPAPVYLPQPAPAPIVPQVAFPQPAASCLQPPCPGPISTNCIPPTAPNCVQPVIPRPCPLAKATIGGGAGGICSWMLAPLIPGPSPRTYMQCVPKSPGQYCGVWLPRPCAVGTRFDARLQVCVHDESAIAQAASCGPSYASIGPCNVQQQCPGQATCMSQNVCCQQVGG